MSDQNKLSEVLKNQKEGGDTPPPAKTPIANSIMPPVSKQDELNYLTRWVEDSRFFGGVFQGYIDYSAVEHSDVADNVNAAYDAEVGTLAGLGSGIIMGFVLHFLFRRYYKAKKSLNPLYRTFKTLASLGMSVGIFIANILPMPATAKGFFAAVFADIACLVIGLFALPYWLIRQYILKTPANLRHQFTKTGNEGWSKYAKTALVFGTYLGQALGALFGYVSHSNLLTTLAIGSAVGAITCFAASLIFVPLINKFFAKKLITEGYDIYLFNRRNLGRTYFNKNRKALILTNIGEKCAAYFVENGQLNSEPVQITLSPSQISKINEEWHYDVNGKVENISNNDLCIADITTQACLKSGRADPKDQFRNNYIRTGITLGLAVGSILGFILGTLIFPGLGSLIGMLLGGAVTAIFGGILIGKHGHKISYNLQKKLNITTESDNSWDYASRSTSYAFAFLGAAIGFFVPVPGGFFIGAALGSAIGGVIGWFAGLGIVKKARKMNPVENKAETLPWTQRVGSGLNIGSIIGAVIGFGLGVLGGPLGALAGATLGLAVGGVIGSACGALADKPARGLMKQALLNEPPTRPRPVAITEAPESETTQSLYHKFFKADQIDSIAKEELPPLRLSHSASVENRYHSFSTTKMSQQPHAKVDKPYVIPEKNCHSVSF